MITELIIVALLDLGSWLLSLLPEDSIDWPASTVWQARIADNLGGLDAMLPLSEFALVLEESLTVAIPVLFAFRLSLFIWFMLPVIK